MKHDTKAGQQISAYVAPRRGAWIETIFLIRKLSEGRSPLAEGRGLKLMGQRKEFKADRRPSQRGVD